MVMMIYAPKLYRRIDEAENVSISVSLENVKRKGGENSVLQIRTNPPSPQCFSATRVPGKTTPPSKSKMMTMVCTYLPIHIRLEMDSKMTIQTLI